MYVYMYRSSSKTIKMTTWILHTATLIIIHATTLIYDAEFIFSSCQIIFYTMNTVLVTKSQILYFVHHKLSIMKNTESPKFCWSGVDDLEKL